MSIYKRKFSSFFSPFAQQNKEGRELRPFTFEVWNLKLVPYQEGLYYQQQAWEQVLQSRGQVAGIFIVCQHHPVVTLGRSAEPLDVTGWTGEVVAIDRGGRATYHGPHQLICYPIIDLSLPIVFRPRKDVGWYLQALQNAIKKTLQSYGLEVSEKPKSFQGLDSSESHGGSGRLSYTGVWVREQKVASIGIGVKKWITRHGLAINYGYDPLAFQGIRPCGFDRNFMVSLEELLKERLPERKDLESSLIQALSWEVLGLELQAFDASFADSF